MASPLMVLHSFVQPAPNVNRAMIAVAEIRGAMSDRLLALSFYTDPRCLLTADG
jgi:hypothetical protein